MIENSSFVYPSENEITTFLGKITVFLVFILGVGFIIVGNTASILLGMLLSSFPLLLLKEIKNVSFNNKYITLNYLVFRKKYINYNQIISITKNIEGLFSSYVYVVKYCEGSSIKKFTFYCSSIQFEQLTNHLNEQGIKQSIFHNNKQLRNYISKRRTVKCPPAHARLK